MEINNKIISFKDLSSVSELCKNKNKKIVLCHGMFDLVHLGHIRYFQQAKKQGDVLIVTITADEFCRKGPGKPAFSEDLRAESLAALEVVDYVAICPYLQLPVPPDSQPLDLLKMLASQVHILLQLKQ